jgi:hypothetical protein
MTGVAPNMWAGDPELLAQQVDQQHTRLDQSLDLSTIHPQHDVRFGHKHLPSSGGALLGTH